MSYLHINKPGLLLALSLISVSAYFTQSQATSSQPISVGYAAHGLRIYVDPDTGQFSPPPPEQVSATRDSPFSAHAGGTMPTQVTLTEQASSRAGGGYTIDLREQYRPGRNRSQQGS